MEHRAPADPATGAGGSVTARPSTEVAAGVALAAVGFTIAALGSVLVLLARDLRLEPADVSWLASAFGASLVVASVVGRRLLALGVTVVLRAGALVLAVGLAQLALAATLVQVVAGALALGVGGAAIVLAVPAMLAGPGAGRRLAAVNAASSAAGVLAPLTLGGLDAATGTGRLGLLLLVPVLAVLVVAPARATTSPPPAAAPRAAVDRAAALGRWYRLALAVSVEFCFVVWAVTRLQATGLGVAGAAATATTFPLGMAVGRAAGIAVAERSRALPLSALTAAAGTVLVVVGAGPVVVGGGLGLAGLGVALLYPVTMTRLLASPGLGAVRGSSAGALASGSAILVAPLALAALAVVLDVRLAFLLVLPLLALVARPQRPSARG